LKVNITVGISLQPLTLSIAGKVGASVSTIAGVQFLFPAL